MEIDKKSNLKYNTENNIDLIQNFILILIFSLYKKSFF